MVSIVDTMYKNEQTRLAAQAAAVERTRAEEAAAAERALAAEAALQRLTDPKLLKYQMSVMEHPDVQLHLEAFRASQELFNSNDLMRAVRAMIVGDDLHPERLPDDDGFSYWDRLSSDRGDGYDVGNDVYVAFGEGKDPVSPSRERSRNHAPYTVVISKLVSEQRWGRVYTSTSGREELTMDQICPVLRDILPDEDGLPTGLFRKRGSIRRYQETLQNITEKNKRVAVFWQSLCEAAIDPSKSQYWSGRKEMLVFTKKLVEHLPPLVALDVKESYEIAEAERKYNEAKQSLSASNITGRVKRFDELADQWQRDCKGIKDKYRTLREKLQAATMPSKSRIQDGVPIQDSLTDVHSTYPQDRVVS